MNKTPFTHEWLLERGFAEKEWTYVKKIGMMSIIAPRLDFALHIEGNKDYYCVCDTTITTLGDLDIFMSYLK